MAADNRLLGQFDLIGIPAAPRGLPQIEVTFDIDANGIVSVSAKDKATNKEQSMRIQPSGGLTEADIQRMVKEAEEHAGDDKSRRELAEAKNQAEALINSTEKNLSEHGSKISPADKQGVESAIQALKDALPGENMSDIAAKTQTLVQASMKIGEAIYAQGGGPGGAGGDDAGGGGGGGDDGVVDAEFEEVDGKKSA
jgi:molecular chaperone DnaK